MSEGEALFPSPASGFKMASSRRVLVVAGEASGEMHAANLVRELRVLRPDFSFFGIGGARMEAAGVELARSFEQLSVVGFTEVLFKLSEIRRAMSELYRETVKRKPDVAILVDYPGFNLRLAKLIRSFVPRIIYYIAPQIWAWGGWRAKSISSLFDALISVIPFECSLYERTKLKCHFVGHPVLDLVRPVLTKEEFRAEYCPSDGMLMGMMPGSRNEEVRRILPVMLNCARVIRRKLHGVSFVVAVADPIESDLVRSLCRRIFDDVSIVKGKTHELMQASDLLMVASGTATLEAAVLGVPMSIIYRTSPLTWALAKGLVRVESVGLANIIAGRRVVPEFIQFDATPERVSQQILSLVEDPARIEEMKQDLKKVKARLGTPGASKRAAKLVIELLEEV